MPAFEGMGQQVMATRMRSFYVASFRHFSGLTVDDLYTGVGITVNDPVYRIRLGLSQVHNIIGFLQGSGIPAKLDLSQTDESVVEDEEEYVVG